MSQLAKYLRGVFMRFGRGRDVMINMEFGGQRFDGSVLSCITSMEGEFWSIDVPAVLWILERIAAGDVDPHTVYDELRRATSWDSDCCGECDAAAPYLPEARRLHEESVRRWKEARPPVPPADFPYVLNKGKIHTRACRRPTQPAPPEFPEDLHAFALLYDGYEHDLQRVIEALEERANACARPLAVAEVTAMMARDGVAAVTRKRCGSCKPSLPVLDLNAPEAQPACWSWAVPLDARAELAASTVTAHVIDVNVLPHQRDAFIALERWQDGRCAVCSSRTSTGGMDRDHDHASGLIRGLLCSSCNTAEGRATDSPLFQNYRLRPPAAILNVEILYLPPGFTPGVRHLDGAVR